MSIKVNLLAQYLGSGDPVLKDYYPPWLENMADDATVEGSMLDGVVVGAESVRSVVLTIKSLYDRQEFKFVGPMATAAGSRTTSLKSTASRSVVWS